MPHGHDTPPEPSRSQVDKAGEKLRTVMTPGPEGIPDPEKFDAAQFEQAIGTVQAFRDGFTTPTLRVIERLVEFVHQVAPPSVDDVTARPKRVSSIVKKLIRLEHMRLSQMEDIAGCRAKLPTQREVRRVSELILAEWPHSHVDDYVQNPRPTGYRAVHVVVQHEGRRVEIQLRTAEQNRWADAVEAAGDRLEYNRLGSSLKDGEGPTELVEYFRQAANRIAMVEKGGELDEASECNFTALREQVRPYFPG